MFENFGQKYCCTLWCLFSEVPYWLPCNCSQSETAQWSIWKSSKAKSVWWLQGNICLIEECYFAHENDENHESGKNILKTIEGRQILEFPNSKPCDENRDIRSILIIPVNRINPKVCLFSAFWRVFPSIPISIFPVKSKVGLLSTLWRVFSRQTFFGWTFKKSK